MQDGTVPATEVMDGHSDEEHGSLECRAAPRPACRHRLDPGFGFPSLLQSPGGPVLLLTSA